MHLSVYVQCEVFYFSFIFGIFVGLFYDFFRLLRYLGFADKRAVTCQDIVFMSLTAVFTFLYSQTVVHGHIRLFVLIGILFGAVAYRYSFGMLSGFVFSVIKRLLSLISSGIKFLNDKVNTTAGLLAEKCKNIFFVIASIFYNKNKKVDTN